MNHTAKENYEDVFNWPHMTSVHKSNLKLWVELINFKNLVRYFISFKYWWKILASGGTILQNATIGALEYAQHVPSSFNVAGVSGAGGQLYSDSERVQPVSGNNLGPPAFLQFAKTRKISMERSDPRKYVFILSLSLYIYVCIFSILNSFQSCALVKCFNLFFFRALLIELELWI